MKLKTLTFVLACFGASCMNLAQDTQPPSDVRGICDLLWKKLEPLEHCPDAPIDVLFFDINHDGVPDALVSYREDRWGGGLHGNGWVLWQYKDGVWQESPRKLIAESTVDPSNSVYARGNDFYSLTMDGQKPKVVLAYTSTYKDWEDDELVFKFSQDACEITIDGEGYLKTIPIPALTVDVVTEQNEAENVLIIPDLGEEYNALKKMLVPLSIEVFYPSKPEDGKSPSVATAEQEGGAQISPSRDDKLEIKSEEAGIEKEKASRLWFYAALALLLSAVFYFVRRKKP